MNNEKGITLISVTLTIIGIIVLIGTVVTILFQSDGIIEQKAKMEEEVQRVEVEEKVKLAIKESYGVDKTLSYSNVEAELGLEEGTLISNELKQTINIDGYDVTIQETGEVEVANKNIEFNKEEWDKTATPEDAFIWGSDIPGEEGYNNIIGYNAKLANYPKVIIPSRAEEILGMHGAEIEDVGRQYLVGVQEIYLPETITTIGEYAFGGMNSYGMKSVKEIIIPNSVISIESRAFYGCINLVTIEIQNIVTNIGRQAFEGTGWYDSQPDGEIYINDIFYSYKGNMPENTIIEIKEGTKSINKYAFAWYDSLTTITIPSTVVYIGEGVFSECYNLEKIEIHENNQNYKDIDGVLFSKDGTNLIKYPNGKVQEEYIIPNNVTSIGDSAFYNGSTLTTIKIPDSVTSIGESAFENCDSLTTIEVDGNNQNYKDIEGVLLTKDGTNLIQYPIGNVREEYIIPNSVTSIGNSAFYDCENLTTIEIPDNVTSIGESAFENCDSLTTIEIPNSVTSIGDFAFYNCDSLTTIEIPNSVTSIGDSAFSYCESLTTIEIPNSVTSIGDYAFSYCESLTTIEIPNSVTSIGDYAFYNCESLTTIEIANSVTSIGKSVFSACDSLTTIEVEESNQNYKDIDGVLFTKDGTNLIRYPIGNVREEYLIPNSVTSIGSHAFSACDSLTTIEIPNSVTNIGDYAFSFCDSLTTIEIPNSVTSIGDSAFLYCNNVIINTEINSYAHNYAKEKNIKNIVYSTKELTNQNIIVEIYLSEEIVLTQEQINKGWKISEDRLTISREYENNSSEAVTVTDLVGNETTFGVNISNIDRIAPKLGKVGYSTTEPTNQNVVVTVISNEQLKLTQDQINSGWKLSEDKLTISREYENNSSEAVIVTDLAGNETTFNVNISNIVLSGDINNDNKVDVTDLLIIKRHIIAGDNEDWIIDEDKYIYADMNTDGKVDITDLFIIKNVVLDNTN